MVFSHAAHSGTSTTMSKKRKSKRSRKPYKVTSYRAYLETNRWRKKRRKAVERAGFKCEVCGATENLAVHHLTYRTLGNELPEHLQVLCDGCHSNLHEIDNYLICDPITREYREFIKNML